MSGGPREPAARWHCLSREPCTPSGRREAVLTRRAVLSLVLAASLVSSASPAAAKGNIPTRNYAVITGPGLSHPIVFVAPWKGSVGGFYTSEGEFFLALAGGTGAIPAGRIQTEQGNYIPDGVLPIDDVPSLAARGPQYRLTWFRNDVKDVARQNIYPYAPAGPLVYTFPSSRQALIALFGRFQAPNHLWTGWGRATSFDLKTTLQFYGLPTIAPEVRAGQGSRSSGGVPDEAVGAAPTGAAPTVGAVVPPSHSAPVSAVAVSVVLLVLLATAVLWLRRRSRVDPAER